MEKVIYAAIVVAAAGIVIFWIAGFNGNLDLSKCSLLAAGIAAGVADVTIGLRALRRWRCGF